VALVDIERVLKVGEPFDLVRKYLRALPPGVDPVIAAQAAVDLIREADGYHPTWLFVRSARTLPVNVIREVLPRLPPMPHAVFLREAFDGSLASWDAAIEALVWLQSSYGWGSKPMRQRLRAIASNPRLLGALQASVVASAEGDERDLPALAVLASDGSEASLDALLPVFTRALAKRDDGLDDLARLETHAASTPALKAMFAQLASLRAERQQASPARLVAQAMGLDSDDFEVHVSMSSVEARDRLAIAQGHVGLDSTRVDWFRVSIHRQGLTSFDQHRVWKDDLGLGRCDALALPGWLASTATRLGIRWSWQTASMRGSVRGKRRAAIIAWLAGSAGELPAPSKRRRYD
jgi:hypothetical protein